MGPTVCNEQNARLIMNAEPFVDAIPAIRLLTRCPVLIERDGTLVTITGYDLDSAILADDWKVPTVALEDAVKLLNEALDDFSFATPHDRSRALASIITPALIHGDLLGGRAPVDLGEADASQTGKGYRNKLTAAIYGERVATVTQRRGGVGSLEESFDSVLIRGDSFIALDNMRGTIDSPKLESFMTEDRYQARIPYSRAIEIDPSRITIMMTSNRAELTKDWANRTICVEILKQSDDYVFGNFPEGDLLDHVRANKERYLGAVFAVIKHGSLRGSRNPTNAVMIFDAGQKFWTGSSRTSWKRLR